MSDDSIDGLASPEEDVPVEESEAKQEEALDNEGVETEQTPPQPEREDPETVAFFQYWYSFYDKLHASWIEESEDPFLKSMLLRKGLVDYRYLCRELLITPNFKANISDNSFTRLLRIQSNSETYIRALQIFLFPDKLKEVQLPDNIEPISSEIAFKYNQALSLNHRKLKLNENIEDHRAVAINCLLLCMQNYCLGTQQRICITLPKEAGEDALLFWQEKRKQNEEDVMTLSRN